jgi:hypothetical protein
VGHDMHLSYCSRGPTAPLIIIMREKINMLSGLGRRKLSRREGRRERTTTCHDDKKGGKHNLP